jgi:hypothetical protein
MTPVNIDPEIRRAARSAIDDSYDAADGDSNDHEIAVLQECRDMLADLVGYVPREAR